MLRKDSKWACKKAIEIRYEVTAVIQVRGNNGVDQSGSSRGSETLKILNVFSYLESRA